MNKLQFHEGGQPIQLDDLQLLQDNDTNSLRYMIEAITGHTKAFLLDKIDGKIVSVDQEKMLTTFDVAEGILFIEGEFISFPGTRLTISSWDVPLYICIKETPIKERVFQDGQTHSCVMSRQAYISLDKSGAQKAYDVTTLPTLKQLLCEFVGTADNTSSWKTIPVTFFNGYSGEVQLKKYKGLTRVDVSISSEKGEWDKQYPIGKLFEINGIVGIRPVNCCSGLFRIGGMDKNLCALEMIGYTCFLRSINSVAAGSNELSSPRQCPVSFIFEIPA